MEESGPGLGRRLRRLAGAARRETCRNKGPRPGQAEDGAARHSRMIPASFGRRWVPFAIVPRRIERAAGARRDTLKARMKSALWLMCCSLGLGCSAAAPSAGGVSGAPAAASGAAGSAVGGGGSAGAPGAGGISTTGGNQPMGGAAGGAGSAGSNAGTTNGGGAESGGTAGSAGAGVGGASGCVPDPGGGFSIVGDTVHDSKTCLDWLKTTQAGVNYAAAEMFCGDATTGG